MTEHADTGSLDAFMKRREEVAATDRAEVAALRRADGLLTEAQHQHIVREVVDTQADVRGQSLGHWVALLPTKMGGGTYAIDLHSNRVLGRSGTGITATTARSATICAPSRAPIRCTDSSSSTRRRAARMR